MAEVPGTTGILRARITAFGSRRAPSLYDEMEAAGAELFQPTPSFKGPVIFDRALHEFKRVVQDEIG